MKLEKKIYFFFVLRFSTFIVCLLEIYLLKMKTPIQIHRKVLKSNSNAFEIFFIIFLLYTHQVLFDSKRLYVMH